MSARQHHERFDEILNKEGEQPVPAQWRPTLERIVACLSQGDFELAKIERVRRLSKATEKVVKSNLSAYGEAITSLPREAWESSFVTWTGDVWEVCVDLWTNSGRSDLVLFVRVAGSSQMDMSMTVDSLHVP